MPAYESPALYIDFSRLPPPAVIEEIKYETLLSAYKAGVLARNPALEQALALEQSATNIILETEAYGEYLVRERINAAARAVMLAFAKGTDLDAMAANFNVVRMTRAADPLATPPIEALVESDAALRRRAQLAFESPSTAGSEGAYIFHALSSDVTIKDASAEQIKPGRVRVSLLSNLSDPIPTAAQLARVKARLLHPAIKPLTDMVTIVPGRRIETEIKATVTLYPGPDATLVMNDIAKALQAIRARVSLLGRDLTRQAIFGALSQEGVQNATVISPAQDIVASKGEYVFIKNATITDNPDRTE